ncbi:MAG: efflux RND transporter periplasmic adaptor subunit [Pseudomonadales bacterium]
MSNRVVQIVLVILIFAGGIALGIWFSSDQSTMQGTSTEQDGKEDKEPLYYRNPMNPEITSPEPAKDEMGMDYIPVYANDEQEKIPGTVTIDPVTMQSMGVRTARVQRESLSRVVRAPGRVDYDEESMTRLHPKTDGWIERLRVNTTGERVNADDILLDIYSPNLVTSQEEYLLTLRSLENARQGGDAQAIARAERIARLSRERLTLLDVPEHQIVELEESKQVTRTLHIHTPFRGVVTKVGVREGQYVTPGTELFMIADLSRVWVYVDVYEHELPWIREGDKAEMEVVAAPGRTFTGEITYIYPYMEAQSRTVRVRLEFPNEDGILKPDMFANVNILANTQREAVVVPTEAIVRSGAREQVFVVRSPGKFEPREVTLGLESGERTQILEGVEPGEKVVTSGQFLIDSESRLNEATAKMQAVNDKDAQGMEGNDMEGHD